MPKERHDQRSLHPDVAAAAAALHRLADQLAADALETPTGPEPLKNLERVRIALSLAGEEVALDLQIKVRTRSAEAPTPGQRDEPSFKAVKKRMARTLKALQSPLRKGEVPALEVRQAFVEESAQMVALSRWEDPAFAAFLTAAQGLLSLESAEALQAQVARLRELERACHARHRGKSKG